MLSSIDAELSTSRMSRLSHIEHSTGWIAQMACADPESFVRGGPTLTLFFLFFYDEGREDQNTTITDHHWPASKTPFKWRWRADVGPTLKAGLVAL